MSAKNKKKFDYKHLKISSDYQYSPDKEQEEQEEKQDEKQEEQKKQDKKPFDPDEVIERIINKEGLPINNELFKKHFKLEKPTFKVL